MFPVRYMETEEIVFGKKENSMITKELSRLMNELALEGEKEDGQKP
jgi:hypothetical protein